MAEIAHCLLMEVSSTSEQFDLMRFALGKTLELAQRLNARAVLP
jgi:hypothetical protein